MRIILYLEEDEPSTITRIAEPSVKTCQHDALVAHQVVECAFAEDEAQDWENLQVPRGDDDLIIGEERSSPASTNSRATQASRPRRAPGSGA